MDLLIEFLDYAPHKMVFQSLLALVSAISIIIFYHYVYPKLKLPYWLVLLLISIPPIISIFRPGVYESGDFTIHVARSMSFYKALSDNVLVPRWAAELNAHYGYAVFNFYYPLPYYISSLFHAIGFSFVNSIKILMAGTYIFSGLFMYAWLKKHVNPRSALLGAIVYLFTPYHLIDLHFRATVGELTSFMFLPLTFLLLDRVLARHSPINIFLAGITIALLIISHPAIAIVSFPILILYTLLLLNKAQRKNIIKILLPFLLGMLLSVFYWLPAIVETDHVQQKFSASVLEFPLLQQLFVSPYRFGLLFQGPEGQLTYPIGIVNWIAIILVLYLIIFRKIRNKKIIFFTLLTVLLIFMIQPLSRPVWIFLPLIKSMLITTRLLLIIALTTSVLAAFALEHFKNKYLFYFLASTAILSTILNWGNRRTIPEIQDMQIRQELPYITAGPEGAWNAIHYSRPGDDLYQKDIPEQPLEAVIGDIEILRSVRTNNEHFYIVYNEYDGLISANTYYFPGWKVYINDNEVPIIFDHQDHPGIILFQLGSGLYNIRIVFEDTLIRNLSNYISTATLIGLGIFLLIYGIKYKLE